MTVCLYGNGGVPFFLSDCLATPRGSGDAPTIPATISLEDRSAVEQNRNFYRKFFQIDDHTMLVFAGDYCSIHDFAHRIRDPFSQIPDCYRPMEFLGMKIDEYNRSPLRKGEGFTSIGATYLEVDGCDRMNVVYSKAKSQSINTDLFGEVVAIGTGATDVLSTIANFKDFEFPLSLFKLRKYSPEAIIGLTGSLNAAIMWDPDLIDGQTKRNWAGLLQLNYFDRKIKKWISMPAWAYFFVVAGNEGRIDSITNFGLVSLFIPGKAGDLISIYNFHMQDGWQKTDFNLLSIFKSHLPNSSDLDIIPERITFSIFRPWDDINPVIYRTLSQGEMKCVRGRFHQRGWSLDFLDHDFRNSLMTSFAQRWKQA